MESVLESTGANERLDPVDRAVRAFEEERKRGGGETLARIWRKEGPASGQDLSVLAALVKADLRHRFDQGETPSVHAYIGSFPELRSSDNQILSLIYEEFCLREEQDESVSVESFCGRYPEWEKSLISQLKCHRLISHAAAGLSSSAPKFPKPGDSFGEFELISALGIGGSSRVFLARDTSLGGREVVLKVAVDRGNEPMLLGRLEHPHIVWVNSVAYQPESRLRGLSMPYHPGRPLDEVIKRLDQSALPSHARIFWDSLVDELPRSGVDSSSSMAPALGQHFFEQSIGHSSRPLRPEGDGWKGFPIQGSYADGVAWIGLILADALHHAHGKGIFHRDIKPANVLMTVSEGPQLLDFNLAESPHSAERAQDALHGGTLPYMAPEQIEAFLDPKRWGSVGAEADIYSLGLVLRELLTGRLPDLPGEGLPRTRALSDFLASRSILDTSIRRCNRSVPYALEAIVGRCLEFLPHDRYANAAELAFDLDRYLRRWPLARAKNPSRRERFGNWLGRNRRFVELGIVAAMSAGALLNPLPVERNPVFGRAERAYQLNQDTDAISPLEQLSVDYPKSPLPQLYLGVARAPSKFNRASTEKAFHQALSLPNAVPTIVRWARSRSSNYLVERLDEFAAHSVGLANGFAEEQKSQAAKAAQVGKVAQTVLVAQLGQATLVAPAIQATLVAQAPQVAQAARAIQVAQGAQATQSAFAREACDLSLAIAPEEVRSLHWLATVEEIEKRYDLAYELISRSQAAIDRNNLGNPRANFSMLLSKGRIATRWAEQRLKEAEDDEVRRATSEFIATAISDLNAAEDLGLKTQITMAKVVPTIRNFAVITLAEAKSDLADFKQAREQAELAEKMLQQLFKESNRLDEGDRRNQYQMRDRLDQVWLSINSEKPRWALASQSDAAPTHAVQ